MRRTSQTNFDCFCAMHPACECPVHDELTDDEKMTAYRIVRNNQDRPKEVVKLLTDELGQVRLYRILDWLKTVVGTE